MLHLSAAFKADPTAGLVSRGRGKTGVAGESQGFVYKSTGFACPRGCHRVRPNAFSYLEVGTRERWVIGGFEVSRGLG